MKDKTNQFLKDKFVLIMLVLSLIVMVAAIGTVTVRKGNQNLDESPYLEIKEPNGLVVGENDASDIPGDLITANTEPAAEPADAAVKGQTSDLADNSGKKDAALSAEHMPAAEVQAAADSLALDFTEEERLAWPVQGNVILSYSMDTTTYFPTLEQYKCNPANMIQSEVSTPVLAPANARVLEIGVNEEIGNFVRLDLGNGYTAICGQLKEIPVVTSEYLKKGDTIGYIAEPTKYYSVEGINLYFELQHEGTPIDALDYLE